MFLIRSDGHGFEVRPMGTQKRCMVVFVSASQKSPEELLGFCVCAYWGRLWSHASLKNLGRCGTSRPVSFAI